MDIEQLEKRLEFWKRGMLVALGASATLLATTLVENSSAGFSGWYIVWLIIWLAVAPPGFYLLMSKKWRKIPISSRLDTGFGYLGSAWLVLLSAGFKAYQNANSFGCNTWIIIVAFIGGAVYWYLRKKKDAPEEMFP